MKKLLLTSAILPLTSYILFSQSYCGTSRYDTEMFSSVTTATDVVYGQNLDLNNNTKILKMDVYQPAGDVATQRPLIILAHGGSFIGGSKTNAEQVTLCTRFAKRGYVVATIDYRIGMGFPINQASAQKAVWRATQDMKAAVRFFRKDAATTNTYKIDPNYVFVGGYSAGAFMGVQYAYMDQPSEIPAAIDTNQLGGFEGNSGNPGYSTAINGVLNLAGAVGDTAWMYPGDEPMVTVQGDNDATVPYCTDIIVVSTVPIMVVSGGGTMHIRCFNTGIENPIHTYYNGAHSADISPTANMDSTIALVSNFVYQKLGCTPSANPNIYINNQTCVPNATDINNEFVLNNENISIYPNPSTGEFNVQSSELSNQNLEVYNMIGEIVFQQTVDSNKEAINLSGLQSGVYLLNIKSESGSYSAKLIKY